MNSERAAAALSTPSDKIVSPTKDIKESIAALRSILMIDTPTKSLLSGMHPTVAAQQSRHETTTRQTWDELARLRSTAVELKTKVQAATTEAEHETRQRKTLQATYDALAEHRKELSVQLELVTKSRDVAEEQLAAMRKSLNEERASMAHERLQWRPQLEKLKKDNEILESKRNELEAQCSSSKTKELELNTQVVRRQNAMAKLEAELRSCQELNSKQTAEQNLAMTLEKRLASVQEELNTIKCRHQKSLGSMLEIQQKLKTQLQQALLDKKTTQDELAESIAARKKAEKAKHDEVASIIADAENSKRQMESKMASTEEKNQSLLSQAIESKEAMESSMELIKNLRAELDAAKLGQKAAEDELNTWIQNHEGNEEARKRVTEEARQSKAHQEKLQDALEKMEAERNELQIVRGEARTLPSFAVPEGLADDLPSSIMALDELIQQVARVEDAKLNYQFVRQLSEVAHEVKLEFGGLKSAKETAESRISTTAASDEAIGYELAITRERLRESRDKLLDSREEAARLREAVALLSLQLENRGTKRTPNERTDDHYEDNELDGEETECAGSSSKRLCQDNYDGTSEDV